MYGSFWLHFILLFVASALAASGFILSKKPDASEIFDKINPFKGIIGIVLLIFGIIGLIDGLKYWGDIIQWMGFWGIVLIASVILEIVIGFLLGYGLVAKFMSGGAKEKMDQMNAKLVAIQNPLGLIGLVVAILMLIWNFTWTPGF
jgi:hypothetical protein